VVVGAGQGGIPFAKAAAQSGRRVALIERRYVAGTCINEGCTPTKAMIASAAVAEKARRAGDFGVNAGEVSVDMAAVRARTHGIVRDRRDGSEERLLNTEGLDLIYGEAHFLAPGELEARIRDGDSLRLHASLIVLDTGSRPAVPDLPGLDQVPFLDTHGMLEVEELPRRLLILGGGYVAVEYGQMMRRFGSEVTIVQRGPRLLSREDEDVSDAVGEILREDGIELYLSAQASRVSPSGEGVCLEIDTAEGGRRITGSHLLVATGRRPNTERLQVEKVGIELEEGGHIKVDERLQTTAAGVYALGDVTGGPAFTHVSYDDYRVLRVNLLEGGRATTTERLIPYTVFTDPQLGRVGKTEDQARESGIDVRVLTLPAASVSRAGETGETRGLLKAVLDRATGRLVGAACLAAEGGELAALLQVAMLGDLPPHRLRDAIFTHPTWAESLNSLFADLDEPMGHG
jgi:pyruvate/2-oxoglutarate dehydrogenase complex dihydrolipoamide dehydrogenase (E3) component